MRSDEMYTLSSGRTLDLVTIRDDLKFITLKFMNKQYADIFTRWLSTPPPESATHDNYVTLSLVLCSLAPGGKPFCKTTTSQRERIAAEILKNSSLSELVETPSDLSSIRIRDDVSQELLRELFDFRAQFEGAIY